MNLDPGDQAFNIERKIMGHGSSQIFTDKLFWVRLAAKGVVKQSLQEEISLFFSRRRRWDFIGF
jgi:hypothetical protein